MGDVAAFERVFHVVSTQIVKHPVVVVSAMTKVTDALLAAFEMAKKGDFGEAIASLEPHFERHVDVVVGHARREAAGGIRHGSRLRLGRESCDRKEGDDEVPGESLSVCHRRSS